LRGCVGTFGTPKPLGRSVARLAAAACCDPRFAPVEAHEIPALTIQISVLTPPRRVHDVLEIAIGRDGLLVEEGERRGLLLPQVAVEHRWDREAFLGHTCLKAQLPRDAWRNGASIYRFEAEVFG
jgi:AmmeMemoRadiSam system protein A